MDSIDPSLLAGVAGIGAGVLVARKLDRRYYISRDLTALATFARFKLTVGWRVRSNSTVPDVWEATVRAHPTKAAMEFEGRVYTFQQLDDLANQVAHWARAQGVKQKDVVALYMTNRPEFAAIWIGIAKLGAATALFNHNLTGRALLHSQDVAGAHMLMFSQDLAEAVQDVRDEFARRSTRLFCFDGPCDGAMDMHAMLQRVPAAPVPQQWRAGTLSTDPAILVYTSGTTGLPKAASIPHLRVFNMALLFTLFFGIRNDDRIFCVLPLYHSAGGICGVGMMIESGATMVLKKKFSASKFWPDVRESKATVIQYIGELCRYLLQAPATPRDPDNHVRIAIGNGLRPEIWPTFQERFNIPQVGEFYGSTEGNAALVNLCRDKESQGAVGHSGALVTRFLQMPLVKFDVEREEPVRGPDGFCVRCAPGEAGELLGRIDNSDPMRRFSGYYGNEQATSSKILRDVFQKGDMWFRTGDLLRHDKRGFWYFVDRIGDTFRWKGENVATTEVAEVLSVVPGVLEANVYGVAVPNADGRACMAALVADSSLDLDRLAAHCREHLPSYARPLFLRLLPQLDITGTFKHQKVKLRDESIDPAKVTDPLFILDSSTGKYVPFTQEQYDNLVTGHARL